MASIRIISRCIDRRRRLEILDDFSKSFVRFEMKKKDNDRGGLTDEKLLKN
jgi:hypothetical protein